MPHAYALARRKSDAGKPAKTGAKASKAVKRAVLIWTPEEKERLARDSLALMKQFPDLTRTECLRRASLRLPKDRQKPVSDINHNMWIIPLWEQFAEEKDAMNAAAEAVEVPQSVSLPFAQEEPEERTNNDTAPAPKKHRGMKPGTKLTRWNAAERRIVAKGFLKLQADFPDLSKTECVRRSMQYNLPDSRQRTVTGYTTERPWLEPLLIEVENEVKLEREAQAQHRADVEAAERAEIARSKEIETIEKTAVELAEIAAQEARETALVEFRQSVSMEELLGMFARKLVKSLARPLIEALREEITGAMSDFTVEPTQKPAPALRAVEVPKNRKPVVGVFGLIHQQAQQLQKDYAGRCEFVFGGDRDGTGPRGGYEKLEKCDKVLLMGEYVSHEVRDRLKQSHVPFESLLGSMSACRVAIDKWLSGEGRLAA